jgi:hypothetical protein
MTVGQGPRTIVEKAVELEMRSQQDCLQVVHY